MSASVSEEQTKLEYEALMEEYKALKEEMNSAFNAGREITNYTSILVGALVPALPIVSGYIIQMKDATILLVIPAIFYLLAWSALRYKAWAVSISDYIRSNTAPKIRESINNLSPSSADVDGNQRSFEKPLSKERIDTQSDVTSGQSSTSQKTSQIIFSWEENRRAMTAKYKIFYLPIAGAHFGLPLLGAVLTIGAYCVIVSSQNLPRSAYEFPLLFVNGLCLIYSLIWGFALERLS